MPYIVKYSLKRIFLLIVTTFIILTITFFLVKLLPDPAMTGNAQAQYAYCMNQVSLGYYLRFETPMPNLGDPILQYVSPDGIVSFFYKTPLIQQYVAWLTNIFTTGNWGVSSVVQPNAEAMTIILSRITPTIIVNVFALIISLPLGFLFGIWAALKKNKATDHIISTVVMIFISVPSFVVISLLMLWLSYSTGWLPSSWPKPGATLVAYVKAMVIPVFALAVGTIATFTRYTRAELCEVMSSDFLLLARTKGLTKTQCLIKHALRNSMVPLVPMVIGQFVGILSGSMILEQLYGIPGIGSLFIDCINARDYNVLLVDMAVFTTIGLLASLLVDISYGIVDPRIRMGAKAA